MFFNLIAASFLICYGITDLIRHGSIFKVRNGSVSNRGFASVSICYCIIFDIRCSSIVVKSVNFVITALLKSVVVAFCWNPWPQYLKLGLGCILISFGTNQFFEYVTAIFPGGYGIIFINYYGCIFQKCYGSIENQGSVLVFVF